MHASGVGAKWFDLDSFKWQNLIRLKDLLFSIQLLIFLSSCSVHFFLEKRSVGGRTTASRDTEGLTSVLHVLIH